MGDKKDNGIYYYKNGHLVRFELNPKTPYNKNVIVDSPKTGSTHVYGDKIDVKEFPGPDEAEEYTKNKNIYHQQLQAKEKAREDKIYALNIKIKQEEKKLKELTQPSAIYKQQGKINKLIYERDGLVNIGAHLVKHDDGTDDVYEKIINSSGHGYTYKKVTKKK